MPYDRDSDSYTCPNGKKLLYVGNTKRKTDNGFVSVKRNYVCGDCSGCPHRDKCFKGRYENRTIAVSHIFLKLKRDAESRVCTPDGILLRTNRSIQVEGAFGVIKEDHGFRRFLTRGKQKTETQFFILAFAFNIRKLCARLDSNRTGSSLFQR